MTNLNYKELRELQWNVKSNIMKGRVACDWKIRKNSWTYEEKREIEERVVFLEGLLTKLNKIEGEREWEKN